MARDFISPSCKLFNYREFMRTYARTHQQTNTNIIRPTEYNRESTFKSTSELKWKWEHVIPIHRYSNRYRNTGKNRSKLLYAKWMEKLLRIASSHCSKWCLWCLIQQFWNAARANGLSLNDLYCWCEYVAYARLRAQKSRYFLPRKCNCALKMFTSKPKLWKIRERRMCWDIPNAGLNL